jgi:hypothetical protein
MSNLSHHATYFVAYLIVERERLDRRLTRSPAMAARLTAYLWTVWRGCRVQL